MNNNPTEHFATDKITELFNSSHLQTIWRELQTSEAFVILKDEVIQQRNKKIPQTWTTQIQKSL
jgi:hypothetical protein